MIEKIKAVGKTYVATEGGQHLSTCEGLGKMKLPNGQFVQVKRAFVNAASNATTELLPAVADAVCRVLSMIFLQGGTAGTVTLKSGTDAISPLFSNAANGGAVLPHNPHGWFQTNVINEALNVTVSNSSDCGVIATFVEIPTDCLDLL